jgi:predicted unusual protein kinase regulating ubiquinone biosynthesis (AarF/ABC1/UbiB family)
MGAPPRGRISRIARLSFLATGLAKDAAASAAILATGRKDAAAERFHRRAAELLCDVMGSMKGMPMKLGQMLSYIDDFLPPAYTTIYREALAKLQVFSKPMPFKMVEKVIRQDLGSLDAFQAIDPTPIAAASIGQVHKGTLKDGTAVAIKVQYPGIASAMQSDLANVTLLKNVLSLILPKYEVEQSLKDLTSRLAEECDYGCELVNQQLFEQLWRGDAEVVVPRAFPDLSRDHVLVSELLTGRSWAEIAKAPQEERNRIGRILFRYVFRSLYVFSVFNADPHPGNYLFLADGRVAFLDYGCVQRYSSDAVTAFLALRHLIMAGGSGATLRAAITAAYQLQELDEREWKFSEEYIRCCFEPVLSARFSYDKAYGERLADYSRQGAFVFGLSALKKGVSEAKRPGFLFLGRLMYGFTSLMVSLGAEGNWREEIERIDAERDAALSVRA